MSKITVDPNKNIGRIKPMNAVNNGPVKAAPSFPLMGNFDSYRDAKFSYVRNHDASFCHNYGGEKTVDINAIFSDFSKDPYDPESYDFACSDYYHANILEAGCQIFYRLGNKIDHRIKKYDSIPPADYHKWAIICEHIIKHYNEGWANGFHHNIEYWEIWNEPDNNPTCWLGTLEEYYELYSVAAKHLKEKFPNIKIGGPAFATRGTNLFIPDFLTYIKEKNAPLDFLSWHTYRADVSEYLKRMLYVRKTLDEFGFKNAESILSEWNYIINWKDGLRESRLQLITIKGAAFVAAMMLTGQNNPLDMLMYYDARPCALNGIFDFYTYDCLKTYYTFTMFSKLYEIGEQIEAECDEDDVYVTAAGNREKTAVMISYFTNDNDAKEKVVDVVIDGAKANYSVRLLDNDNDSVIVDEFAAKEYKLTIQPNTVVLIESKN